jgi:C4-type Zn-finger protein
VDRALERAEAVLTWVLGDEAKDMDVAKAQRALKVIDALVEKRRAATKAAADPVQALALVEKAEKKRGLLQELVSALLLQQEAEGALRQR